MLEILVGRPLVLNIRSILHQSPIIGRILAFKNDEQNLSGVSSRGAALSILNSLAVPQPESILEDKRHYNPREQYR